MLETQRAKVNTKKGKLHTEEPPANIQLAGKNIAANLESRAFFLLSCRGNRLPAAIP